MVLEVDVNPESIKKLEKFYGTGKYKDLAVNTQSFSRKLNEERKMRIPYVDGQVIFITPEGVREEKKIAILDELEKLFFKSLITSSIFIYRLEWLRNITTIAGEPARECPGPSLARCSPTPRYIQR